MAVSAPFFSLRQLHQMTQTGGSTLLMPALFLGHGSPMNAIEENEFVQGFRKAAATLPKPRAILCISAHWETRGTKVTAMENPRTIHDFGGFPQALYEVQYPAPGSPALAEATRSIIKSTPVETDLHWGLDHGCWSVVKHLYPAADVPVVQMSLNFLQPPEWHYALGKELAALRKQGVLIAGSGNMVHNLGLVAWDKLHTSGYAYDWAEEAAGIMRSSIETGRHDPLIHYRHSGKSMQLAIPTPEHFLPLLYILALQTPQDELQFFNDRAVAGSLTMTSLRIGSPA